MSKEHVWQVGELCACVSHDVAEGIVYRVIEIKKYPGTTVLVIQPILGVLANIRNKRNRELGAGWCTPLSLVDLASVYSTLGIFIAEEAKRRGIDG